MLQNSKNRCDWEKNFSVVCISSIEMQWYRRDVKLGYAQAGMVSSSCLELG